MNFQNVSAPVISQYSVEQLSIVQDCLLLTDSIYPLNCRYDFLMYRKTNWYSYSNSSVLSYVIMSMGYALVLCSVSPFRIALLPNWISKKEGGELNIIFICRHMNWITLLVHWNVERSVKYAMKIYVPYIKACINRAPTFIA